MSKKELIGLTADHLFWDPHFHERLEKDRKILEAVSKDPTKVIPVDYLERLTPPDLSETTILLTLDSLGTYVPPRKE